MSLIGRFKSALAAFFTLGYAVGAAFFGITAIVVPLGLFVRPVNRKLFFLLCTRLFGCYWFSLLIILEHINQTKIKIYGQMPQACDNVLVLSNHKCDLDYAYLWSALARSDPLRVGLFKAVLKSAIKRVPVFAWGLKASGFLYLSRDIQHDLNHIQRWSASMARDHIPMWLVLYPEGTRFTPARKVKSDEVAVQKGLRPFESELLMPRTKGLVLLAHALEGHVTTVVDMTIAYSKRDGTLLKGSELGTSCLGGVFCGDSPVGTVHIHFQHHPMHSLPKEAEPLSQWCHETWQQKNKLLVDFAKTGSFSGTVQQPKAPSVSLMLTYMCVFWSLIFIGIWMLYTNTLFRWYFLVASCLCTAITMLDPPDW